MNNMNFGAAIEALKLGKRVARSGWNGKGMFLEMAQYTSANEAEKHPHYHLHNIPYEGLPWIGMKTADSKFVPWLASQTDVLAEDWVIVAQHIYFKLSTFRGAFLRLCYNGQNLTVICFLQKGDDFDKHFEVM